MKPRTFSYLVVRSLNEALDALRAYGEDGKIIAGGQSLVPMMNMRLVSPAVLIDIGSLDELRAITSDGASLRIGALARHRDVQESQLVREQAPLLSKAVALVAHLAVRNRGRSAEAFATPTLRRNFRPVPCCLMPNLKLLRRTVDDASPHRTFFKAHSRPRWNQTRF